MTKFNRKNKGNNQKTNTPPVKTCSINIDGLSEKSRFLLDKYSYDEQFDLVAAQETRTTDKDKLKLTGMTAYCDKNNAKNRGTVIFVKDELPCSEIPEITNITNDLDSVWLLVVIGGKRYIIGNVYVKLHYTNAIQDVLRMLDKAESLCQKLKALGVILCGDLNSRHTFWNDFTCNKYGRDLLEGINLQQFSIVHPETPTFMFQEGSSLIDLFIVSNNLTEKIQSCSTNEIVERNSSAPRRGHFPVITTICSEGISSKGNPKHKIDVESINWKNWTKDFNNNLTSNMDLINKEDDPNKLWRLLEQTISKITKSNAKMKKVCKHSKPFWTRKLTQLCDEMRAARKAYQIRNTDERKERMILTKEIFDEARKKECQDFIMNKTRNLNTAQAKFFWKKFNSLFSRKDKPGIDPLQEPDGSFLTSPEEIEEKLFATFFQCRHMLTGDFDEHFYHTIEDLYLEVKHQDIEDGDYDQVALNAPITQGEIKKAIKSTNMNKTSLDDYNMHPKMLLNMDEVALKVVEKLFNLCLKTGKWVWNSASVIFLKKEGKKSYSLPGAYRPICITSYIGKLLEKIIAARLYAFLISKNYHDPEQEGFTVQRNTIRYLNRLQLEIKSDLTENKTVIALFADMEKAFDSVWKRGLIVKLTNLKIKGKITQLIDDFLQSRIVQLNVNGFAGSPKDTEEYGLPQGSALSPVLFKIYMMDILEDMKYNEAISILKFADDGTIKVKGNSNQECLEVLELVTTSLYQWSRRWRMIINCDPNKTEYICFGNQPGGTPIPDTIQL